MIPFWRRVGGSYIQPATIQTPRTFLQSRMVRFDKPIHLDLKPYHACVTTRHNARYHNTCPVHRITVLLLQSSAVPKSPRAACPVHMTPEPSENIACALAERGQHVGVTIAGNSGRPYGALGHVKYGIDRNKCSASYTTQEEHVVSSAYLASRNHPDLRRALCTELRCMWGMQDPLGEGCRTVQGVDYTNLRSSEGYADAWVLPHAQLCPSYVSKHTRRFDTTRTVPITLVFGAGPNANPNLRGKGPSSTTRRTFNPHAEADYQFFFDSVKAAVRTNLDAMILQHVDVPVLAMISCGIYAGVHKSRILADFGRLVHDVLKEGVGNTPHVRGSYFHEVHIATGAKR